MMDLRLLRNFVAVAEVEHVGRAARTLRISQSPLSRQLRQLEDSLGLQLFDRERQRVRLTNAGGWLLRESRLLLEQAAQLELDAARMARGDSGSVRLGFVKSAMWTGVLPAALRTFRSRRPDVSVTLRNAPSAVQAAALLRGDLDVGLVHDLPNRAGLVMVTLLSEPLLLAVPNDHRLAGHVGISPRDLNGLEWIVLATRPGKHERLIAACGRAGFVPKVRFEASDQASVLGLVEAGVGLALLPESAERDARRSVTLRRLPWLRLSRTLHAIRREGTASPLAIEIAARLKESANAYKGNRRPHRTRRGAR